MNNIYLFRKQRAMTQRKLAARVGCCVDQIKVWERGKRMPMPQNIDKLAKAFGCTPRQLFPDLPELAPPKPKTVRKEPTTMVILKGAHAPIKASTCQFNLLGWCTANYQRAGEMACKHNTAACPIVEISTAHLAELLEMKKDGVKTVIDKATVYPGR